MSNFLKDVILSGVNNDLTTLASNITSDKNNATQFMQGLNGVGNGSTWANIGTIAGAGLNVGTDFYNNFKYATALKDTSELESDIDTARNFNTAASSYDQLQKDSENRYNYNSVSSSNLYAHNAWEDLGVGALNAGKTFLTTGSWEQAALGFTGTLAGLGARGLYAGNKARDLNYLGKNAELAQNSNIAYANNNIAENNYANYRLNSMSDKFNYGGEMNLSGDFTNGITHINAGDTHEQNPLEGVPMGVDQNGTPNLVEEGEVIYDDYVFSNRLYPKDKELEKVFLPTKKGKKETYANIADKLSKESEERPNDPISKKTLKTNMERLKASQEEHKYNDRERQAKREFESLNPEDQMALVQNAANNYAPQQDYMQEETIPTIQAFGGNLFYNGGDLQKYNKLLAKATGYYDSYNKFTDYDNSKILNIIKESDEYKNLPSELQSKFEDSFDSIVSGEYDIDIPEGLSDKLKSGYVNQQRANIKALARGYKREANNTIESNKKKEIKEINNKLAEERKQGIKYRDDVKKTIDDTYNKLSETIVDPEARQLLRGSLNSFYDNNTEEFDIQGFKDYITAYGIEPDYSKFPTKVESETVNEGDIIGPIFNKDFTRGIADEDAELIDTAVVTGESTPINQINGKAEVENKPQAKIAKTPVANKSFRYYNNGQYDQGYLNFLESIPNNQELIDSLISQYKTKTGKDITTQALIDYGKDRDFGTVHNFLADAYDAYLAKSAKDAEAARIAELSQTPNEEVIAEEPINTIVETPSESTTTATDTAEDIDEKEDNNNYPTWARYAPIIGSGLNAFTDLLGITNKPDYTSANRLQSAVNGLRDVSFTPVGQRLTYKPLDRNYYLNQQAAANAANRAAIMNSNANRGTLNAALLAQGYNESNSIGNALMQMEQYNAAQREKAAAFNRDTDKFNSQGFMQADALNTDIQRSRIAGVQTVGQLRDAEKARTDLAKSANLTNFLDNLGDYGRENMAFNMINNNRSEYFGINRDGSLYYKQAFYNADPETKKQIENITGISSNAFGGYLTIKKNRRK